MNIDNKRNVLSIDIIKDILPTPKGIILTIWSSLVLISCGCRSKPGIDMLNPTARNGVRNEHSAILA